MKEEHTNQEAGKQSAEQESKDVKKYASQIKMLLWNNGAIAGSLQEMTDAIVSYHTSMGYFPKWRSTQPAAATPGDDLESLLNAKYPFPQYPTPPQETERIMLKRNSFEAGYIAAKAAPKGDETEWINVHDNSDGFRDFLDSKGIEWKRNEHWTMIKRDVDLYWLGRSCEQWKQENFPATRRNRLFE